MNWYVIIPMIISFIVVFLIGVYASRRVQATAHNKFLQEYFLGGRELGGLLLAMTMIATYGSASSWWPLVLQYGSWMGTVICDSSCNRVYRFNGYR